MLGPTDNENRSNLWIFIAKMKRMSKCYVYFLYWRDLCEDWSSVWRNLTKIDGDPSNSGNVGSHKRYKWKDNINTRFIKGFFFVVSFLPWSRAPWIPPILIPCENEIFEKVEWLWRRRMERLLFQRDYTWGSMVRGSVWLARRKDAIMKESISCLWSCLARGKKRSRRQIFEWWDSFHRLSCGFIQPLNGFHGWMQRLEVDCMST